VIAQMQLVGFSKLPARLRTTELWSVYYN